MRNKHRFSKLKSNNLCNHLGVSITPSARGYIMQEVAKARKNGKIQKSNEQLCVVALTGMAAKVALENLRDNVVVSDVNVGWNDFVAEVRKNNGQFDPKRKRSNLYFCSRFGTQPPHNCMSTILKQEAHLVTQQDTVGKAMNLLYKER